jgi:hypothetical protein
MNRILMIAALVALAGCTDEKGATKALHDAGLKPVRVGGYHRLRPNPGLHREFPAS